MASGLMEVLISNIDAKAFKKLLARNVIVPLVLSLLSSFVFIGLIFFQLSVEEEVERSSETLMRTNRLEKLIMDSETGLRGFLLTGRESFLAPYLDSSGKVVPEIGALKEHIGEVSPHFDRLASVLNLFEQWKNYAEEVIEAKRNGDDLEARFGQNKGKAFVDKIREHFDQINSLEVANRAERLANSRQTSTTFVFLVLVTSILIGGFVAWLGRKQLLELSKSYLDSLNKEQKQNERLIGDQLLKSQLAALSEVMVGERKLGDLCDSVLATLAETIDFSVGAFYVLGEDKTLQLRGTYAVSGELEGAKERIQFGEGLAGQAAKEGKVLHLKNLPKGYLKVSSSLGEIEPQSLVFFPIQADGSVSGVLELGFNHSDTAHSLSFLEQAIDSIGQSIRAAKYRERLELLLKEVREQAKALQAQQEELRVSNEELEEQTKLQRESQARLEAQHAELEQTNSRLESQSRMLEQQKDDLNHKNQELKEFQEVLEGKTKELELSSRYKSEFLANMSHELRTPLNSSLILAKLLADNKEGNLTPQQVEFSEQILHSGNDLLMLINDILDLSKVESGKLEIVSESFVVLDMLESLKRMFEPVAKQKDLVFKVSIGDELPDFMVSDRARIEQILKNLLSNAFKFTSQGEVELRAEKSGNQLKLSVSDTGIGIKPEQQSVIFEAFKQADGTTSRRFGGTGLGLSISKDLSTLLKGSLTVTSEEGVGSTFTLTLPVSMDVCMRPEESSVVKASFNSRETELSTDTFENLLNDDRSDLKEADRSILVIEDDIQFSRLLMQSVREQGFKCLATMTAEEGVYLAQKHLPDAVLLDIGLPDHSGLVVLDQLKQNPETRHVPIHVVSGANHGEQALQMGAIGYLLKPVHREDLMRILKNLEDRIKKDFHDVLIIEDDEIQRSAIAELIQEKEVRIISVGTGEEAMKQLKSKSFDCVIMDLDLPDISGFDLIDQLAESHEISHPPIIVYTGKDLTRDEELRLKRHSQSVIIKGAKSPERLLNEVTLFLHQVESRLSPKRKKILENLRDRERIFESKQVMVVDDDVRNVFALTSVLEAKGAQVIMARHGQEALDHLDKGIMPDLFLMDIMMPIMDGYETMKRVRERADCHRVPIIALTAKAMSDDREKSLEAGASDYLTKPVDVDKLLSLMRVWLSQTGGVSRDFSRDL